MTQLLNNTYVMIWPLLLLAGCWLAWRRGGPDERTAAAMFVAATAASAAVPHQGYTQTETGLLLVDSLLMVGLVLLAARSRRFWPLWAAAFQLVAVMFHIATMAMPEAVGWAYAVGVNFWSVPVMLALIVGCLGLRRAQPAATGAAETASSAPADQTGGHGIGDRIG